MARLAYAVIGSRTLLTLMMALATLASASQPPTVAFAAGNTYVVNSTADTADADVGNGICADASGRCTLRAAVMQANATAGPDTIILPAGTYLLTRPGDDDGAVLGDLDITDGVTIEGAGSGTTIVDGNGNVTGDRVFQILASAKDTTLSGLTIRHGKKVASPFDEGGGLYWDGGGGHLNLSDVVFENNASSYGGGLFLTYSATGDTVELDNVRVVANTATAAAGGLAANLNDFASFNLRDSEVYSNSAYEGGGLYFQGTATISAPASVEVQGTVIYSNTASLSGGIENHTSGSGDPVQLAGSHVYDNQATIYGGAIGNYGTLVISGTTVEANSAQTGGGLYDYEGGQVTIEATTFNNNSAQFGGGLYTELFGSSDSSVVTLTNSTFSGNIASRDGAGLYAVGGLVELSNATIANNHVAVPIGLAYPGMGGGVYVTGTATLSAQNSLLGDNTHLHQPIRVGQPVPDDCFTSAEPLLSGGHNLIETTSDCLIAGTLTGNITGQDPLLGPLQSNLGPTQTQSPLAGSPAIDNGDDLACPPFDQRGFTRIRGAHCDIGAVEYFKLSQAYLPIVNR